jgi:hypothetical protein
MSLRTYQFSVPLSSHAEVTDDLSDRVFKAGCADALVACTAGVVAVHFSRKAPSFAEAVTSALADLRNAELLELPHEALLMATFEHSLGFVIDERDEARRGYHVLDRNWDVVHNSAVEAIREALDMPYATIPAMVKKILALRGVS